MRLYVKDSLDGSIDTVGTLLAYLCSVVFGLCFVAIFITIRNGPSLYPNVIAVIEDCTVYEMARRVYMSKCGDKSRVEWHVQNGKTIDMLLNKTQEAKDESK